MGAVAGEVAEAGVNSGAVADILVAFRAAACRSVESDARLLGGVVARIDIVEGDRGV